MMKFAIVALFCVLLAKPVHSNVTQGVNWPDASIPIPIKVRAFIASECLEYAGWSEETTDECISREMYGYRAVVTMLIDKEFGDRAVERYRGCNAGLGKFGGMFHRRKADCISRAYCIVWRFGYSEETSLPGLRKASIEAPANLNQHEQELHLARLIVEDSYQSLL